MSRCPKVEFRTPDESDGQFARGAPLPARLSTRPRTRGRHRLRRIVRPRMRTEVQITGHGGGDLSHDVSAHCGARSVAGRERIERSRVGPLRDARNVRGGARVSSRFCSQFSFIRETKRARSPRFPEGESRLKTVFQKITKYSFSTDQTDKYFQTDRVPLIWSRNDNL